MVDVFISWSGEISRRIGEEIRNWIPSVLQFAKPYFTPNDIEKGTKWSSEISKKLSDCHIGIICLTPENIDKPWILFEAGALSKNIDTSKVCSILFNMENTDLAGPLTTFQTTQFEKSDFQKLMSIINDAAGSSKLSPEVFGRVFDKWWPDLEAKIKEILKMKTRDEVREIRSDRDLLEEILKISRISARNSSERSVLGPIPSKLITDHLEALEIVVSSLPARQDTDARESIMDLIKINRFLASKSAILGDEHEERISKLTQALEDYIPF
jgi:hypothetical protein